MQTFGDLFFFAGARIKRLVRMNADSSLIGSILLFVCAWWVSPVAGDVEMPLLFGDHMILQQETDIPVWGWADPGEKVVVTLGDQTRETQADTSGAWRIDFDAMSSSSALVLKVSGKNELRFEDVLLGDVWLASGQSNMEFTLKDSSDAPPLEAVEDSLLRFFVVTKRLSLQSQKDIAPPYYSLQGRWYTAADGAQLERFSAVAYHFAAELRRRTGDPIAIIGSYWGGTTVQAWMSPEALVAIGEGSTLRPDSVIEEYDRQFERYENALRVGEQMERPTRPEGKFGTRTVLFHGMIAPLLPYALKGVIWYQGESNAYEPSTYAPRLSSMILDWRRRWERPALPFLFVQLPQYETNRDWPALREAQAQVLQLPHTGMAVTIDLGESDDIHPKAKKDVGHRLALVALEQVYGETVEASGPVFDSISKEGPVWRIHFRHADGLKTVSAGQSSEEVSAFEMAGRDGEWQSVEAKIDGETVIVCCPEDTPPVRLRYAWKNVPDVNLYNGANLPAAPFRCDLE